MKIGIIGNYGASNVGDDAILRAVLKSHPQYTFVVFSGNHHSTHAEFGVKTAPLFPLGFRSFFKNGFRRSVKALRSVDVVMLGGGGLFQDDYFYACFLWAWQIFWVKLFSKPYFVYGEGIGPLKTWWGKKLTKYAHNGAVGITVRDETSANTLHHLGLPRNNIEVTSDPAFLFKGPGHEHSRKTRTYLISLRPWLKYNKKIIDVFTEYLLKLKNEKDAKFIFVCMQKIKERDHLVIDPVAERVGGTVLAPRHFPELLQVMSQAEFVIGMRFHFLLAAMITETPALALSYSHKVDSLYKHSALEPYMLPLANLNVENLAKKMTRLSVDYNNIKIFMKKRTETFRGLAEKNIQYFEGFIKTLTKDEGTDKIHTACHPDPDLSGEGSKNN